MPSSLSSKLRLRAAWGPPYGRAIQKSVLVALFILLAFGLSLVGAAGRPADAAGLKDIQGHWAASEITKAIASGYVKGYPDNTFKPNAGVTRAELVVMLNRALAVAPGQNARSFKDVGSKDWFLSDVQAALSAGYVNGYPDGTFRPQQSVNRQEAACLLAQLMKLDGDTALKFSDTVKIVDWAKPSVGRLVSRGIMAGYPDGAFQPLRVISRAEAVVMINRALALRAPAPVSVQLQVADDLVNVRSAPSQVSQVIGQVRAGDILQAKAKNGENWYQVDYQGGTGWIAGWCVQVVQNPPPPTPADPQPPTPADPQPPTPADQNNPGRLSVQVKQDSNGDTVYINGAQNGSYTWADQTNPQRLVVTVPGVTSVSTPLEIDVGDGSIDRIVTSLTGSSPGTAQVEIDYAVQSATLQYKATPGASGELLVNIPPQIYKIQAGIVSDFLAVNIWATTPVNFQPSRLTDPARLVFDFNGFYLSPALLAWQQQVNAAGVNTLRVGQYQPGTVRLVAETSDSVIYNSDSNNGGQQIVLRIKKADISGGRLVVLDPGHGGDDSGAVGPDGLFEKDVNLAVALKTADLLRGQGVTVVMTRSTDVNPGLDERAVVADSIFATVFVSIHCNSSEKRPDIGGTGTYTYAPPGTPLALMRDDRLRLANDLQDQLCTAVGLRNAGIFEENFQVLRDSAMPAALVEMAFISNKAEEKLLSDPAFQAKAAAGIAQGIVKYLAGN